MASGAAGADGRFPVGTSAPDIVGKGTTPRGATLRAASSHGGRVHSTGGRADAPAVHTAAHSSAAAGRTLFVGAPSAGTHARATEHAAPRHSDPTIGRASAAAPCGAHGTADVPRGAAPRVRGGQPSTRHAGRTRAVAAGVRRRRDGSGALWLLLAAQLASAAAFSSAAAPLPRAHAACARGGPPSAIAASSATPAAALADASHAAPRAAPLPPPPPPPPPPLRGDEYEVLRTAYDRSRLVAFFLRKPAALAGRFVEFGSAYRRLQQIWHSSERRGVQLREEIAKLGPVAVKLGQTLSQRPDLISEDLCEELKTLQTSNTAFPNEQAFAVIAEEMRWAGPVAPGRGPAGATGEPIFRSLTADPIASASLGQVYKGVTHDGREVAVKVQRPGAVRQVALDFAVLAIFWRTVQAFGWGSGDLLEIVDNIATGVFQELDYRIEARNAEGFRESMQFLGYVDVPRTLYEYSCGPRVIVTEWVRGRHLDKLSKEEGLRLTYMAVEAVTASLVVTGFVHADPHEGNLMLHDDGTLIFLDFGLMSRVEPDIMEAFAQGIQSVLNKDYDMLVQAFIKTGFVGTPIQYRSSTKQPWVEGDAAVMAEELRARMEESPGGTSRFGALSTVLFEMGNYWYMYTPPYIILLIRTFLTLEGIAGRVDPNFNIYEVSLPWAVQRALSPCTNAGAEALRSSLLTKDNQLQWDRLRELIEQQLSPQGEAGCPVEEDRENSKPKTMTSKSVAAIGAVKPPKTAQDRGKAQMPASPCQERAGSGASTPFDTVQSLLGSPDGAVLRRICLDLDSTELIEKLVAPDSASLRRQSVEVVASFLTQVFAAPYLSLRRVIRGRQQVQGGAWMYVSNSPFKLDSSMDPLEGRVTNMYAPSQQQPLPATAWPISASSKRLQSRKKARFNQVKWVLVRSHLNKQLQGGSRGYMALWSLVALCVSVLGKAALKAAIRSGIASPMALATAAGVSMSYKKKFLAMVALSGAVIAVITKLKSDDANEQLEPGI